MGELEEELAGIKSDFKGKIKPLQERIGKILSDLKVGGEYVKGECYKFIDPDEGMVGFYTPDGYLLEERPMKAEERQRTIQMAVRLTGTDNARFTNTLRCFCCKRLLSLCSLSFSVNNFDRFFTCVIFNVDS